MAFLGHPSLEGAQAKLEHKIAARIGASEVHFGSIRDKLRVSPARSLVGPAFKLVADLAVASTAVALFVNNQAAE